MVESNNGKRNVSLSSCNEVQEMPEMPRGFQQLCFGLISNEIAHCINEFSAKPEI